LGGDQSPPVPMVVAPILQPTTNYNPKVPNPNPNPNPKPNVT